MKEVVPKKAKPKCIKNIFIDNFFLKYKKYIRN